MRISVVIPTKNRLALLRRAIESIVRQPCGDFEVIVIDNVSDVPVSASDLPGVPDLRIVRNTASLPAGKNRNIGAYLSSGDIICFLDDDDEYRERKFADVIEAFSTDTALDFVYGNTQQIGPGGRLLALSRGPCDLRVFLRGRYVHLNALAVRRHVFDSISFKEDMEKYQDVQFIGRLMKNFRGKHINEVHAVWYRDDRPDQVTRRNLKLGKKCWGYLCTTFEHEIRSFPELRALYLDKMLKLCAARFDLIGFTKFLIWRLR